MATETAGSPHRRRAPEHVETARLVLSPPIAADVVSIFTRYAGDAEATRYLGWPRHTNAAMTQGFIAFSDGQWSRTGMGPYVIRAKADGRLLGGTGLSLDAEGVASTGYVLAPDAWGRGLATEALAAMVRVAGTLGLRRLTASCHPAHVASQRVLVKGGFRRETVQRLEFPNLAPGVVQDALVFGRSVLPD